MKKVVDNRRLTWYVDDGKVREKGGVKVPIRSRTKHEHPGRVPASTRGLFKAGSAKDGGAKRFGVAVPPTEGRYKDVLSYAKHVGSKRKVGKKVTLTR